MTAEKIYKALAEILEQKYNKKITVEIIKK